MNSTENTKLWKLPKIEMNRSVLMINEKTLCLENKPMLKHAIRILVSNSDRSIPAEELIDLIYREYKPQKKSARFRRVLRQNMNKLLSRARFEIGQLAIGETPLGALDFIAYKAADDSWAFWTLTPRFALHLIKNN